MSRYIYATQIGSEPPAYFPTKREAVDQAKRWAATQGWGEVLLNDSVEVVKHTIAALPAAKLYCAMLAGRGWSDNAEVVWLIRGAATENTK